MSDTTQVTIKEETANNHCLGWASVAAFFTSIIPILLFGAGRFDNLKYSSMFGITDLESEFNFHDIALFGFGSHADIFWGVPVFLGFYVLLFAGLLWAVERYGASVWQALVPKKIQIWVRSEAEKTRLRSARVLSQQTTPYDALTLVGPLSKIGATMIVVATLAIVPSAIVASKSIKRAGERAEEEKSALRTWNREQLENLGMQYAVIETIDSTGNKRRYCGFRVQSSPNMAALFNGVSTEKIRLDDSVTRYSTYSMGEQFETVKKIAACECGMKVPGTSCVGSTGKPSA